MMTRRSTASHVLAATCVGVLLTIAVPAAAVGPGVGPQPTPGPGPADGAVLKRRLEASLDSPDLRLRVLAGRAFDPQDETWTRTFVPIDTLAEQTRDSTDPMVLALMVVACDNDRVKPRPTCDPVDMARRWTAVDPQNQVAWLTWSASLHSHGDLVGSKAAFRRAARASSWHEYADDGARVVSRALPPSLGMHGRVADLRAALASSAADLMPDAALDALSFHCKDTAAEADCAHIVDAIDRAAGSMLSARTGIAIGESIGVDPARTAARMQKLDAFQTQPIASNPTPLDRLAEAVERATEASVLQRRGVAGEPGMRQPFAAGRLTSAAAAERDVHRVEALQDFRLAAPTPYAY